MFDPKIRRRKKTKAKNPIIETPGLAEKKPPRIRKRKNPDREAMTRGDKATLSRAITSENVLALIEGTAGIKKTLAERLGCSYRYILTLLNRPGPEWDEVRLAMKIEYDTLGDIAESTVKDAMRQRLDVGTAANTAKWFLDRKHTGRGYGKKDQLTIEGGENPLNINMQMINISDLVLSLDVKRAILDAIREKARLDEKATYETIATEKLKEGGS